MIDTASVTIERARELAHTAAIEALRCGEQFPGACRMFNEFESALLSLCDQLAAAPRFTAADVTEAIVDRCYEASCREEGGSPESIRLALIEFITALEGVDK